MEFKFHAQITPEMVELDKIDCSSDLPAAIYPMIKVAVADRPNGNFVMFTSKSAKNTGTSATEVTGIESLVSPYPKPILHHHDMHSSPVGRILVSGYRRRKATEDMAPMENSVGFKNGNGFFYVVAKVTDPDTIAALYRGELVTVSIGVNATKLVCSITGDDILENFRKGEWPKYGRGEQVDNEICIWIIESWAGREVSFVNEPAEPDATVLSLDIGEEAAAKLVNNLGDFSSSLIEKTDYVAIANSEMIDYLLDGFSRSSTVENPVTDEELVINNSQTLPEPTKEQVIKFILDSKFFTSEELIEISETLSESSTQTEESEEEPSEESNQELETGDEEETPEEIDAEAETPTEETETEDESEIDPEISNEQEASEEVNPSSDLDAGDAGESGGVVNSSQKPSSTKKVFQRPKRKSN